MHTTGRMNALVWGLVFLASGTVVAEPASGPLRVHPDNPRYFTDGSGRGHFVDRLAHLEQFG